MSRGYMQKCVSMRTNLPKKRHETQAAAEEQRSGLIKLGVWTVKGSNTYWCNQCGHWHAGSMNKGSNRGKGRKQAKRTPVWYSQ